jgi:hypothetical protein
MDNIVKFPGTEDIDLSLLEDAMYGPSIEVSEVLTSLQDREFDDIVVLGTYHGRQNMYFASSSGDPAKVLWDLERAKFVLMNMFMNMEDPLDNE